MIPSQGAKCPQFENPDPVLIPVGYKTRISFEGINLDLYQVKLFSSFKSFLNSTAVNQFTFILVFICPVLQGRVFTIGTELMRNVEEEVNFEDGPFYTFNGFNVSVFVC